MIVPGYMPSFPIFLPATRTVVHIAIKKGDVKEF